MTTLYKYFFLLLSCAIAFACGGGDGGGGGGDTTQPTTPTGLTASAASAGQIDLSWSASTDDVGIAGYKVYRNGVYLKSGSGVSTSDTGLSAGTQYCYTVSAYDAANKESAWSVQVYTATPASVWFKTYGTSEGVRGFSKSVKQTADGGYVIAGSTYSYGAGQSDGYLIKTDGAGNTLWTNTFGGSGQDYFHSVQQTRDGGYIMTGSTESYGDGSSAVYLVKTDANGSSLP